MTTQPTGLTCREVEELAGLYALGALDPAEADEVRLHLESHPDVHAQCLEVVSAASSLSLVADPIDPPPELRRRVMEAVSRTGQETSAPSPTPVTPLAEVRPGASDAPRVPAQRDVPRSSPRWTPPLRALAFGTLAVLVAVIVGWGLLSRPGGVTTDSQLALLGDAIVEQARGDANVVELVATEEGGRASGFAVLPPGRPGYIVLAGLPAVEADEVWQAWYLTDGAPASAGLLEVGPSGVASIEGLDPIPSTSGIALTLEPSGGSDAPTTDPVVVGSLANA